MRKERIICCCGASQWTKVIASYELIINSVFIALAIIIADIRENQKYLLNSFDIEQIAVMRLIAFTEMIVAIPGFIMAIFLLKGANQNRIGYIIAWLIYSMIPFLATVFFLVVAYELSDGFLAVWSISNMALRLFFFAVVVIHMNGILDSRFI